VYGRPPVTLREIRRAIGEAWDITPSTVERLVAGHDAHAWGYRVQETNGTPWFAKLYEGAPTASSILVPQHLAGSGLDAVVAPVSTRSGAPWATLDGHPGRAAAEPPTLSLAPFVDGRPALDRPLDDGQWRAYGRFLAALHAVRLPRTLHRTIPRETFRPYNAAAVRAMVATRPLPARGPARTAMAEMWRDQTWRVERLLDRAEVLAGDLLVDPPPNRLCHADIHRGNILVDAAGRLRVVDWDGVVLAPRERDLMFVIDGVTAGPPVTPRQQALFMDGYGTADVNAVALAYYRHAWAIQDIGEYADQVLRRSPVARAEREESLGRLVGQFDVGGQVAAAEAGWDNLDRPPRAGRR
jgi:spectinomycin phosphotransferase